jgi:Na+/H+ antiporter NhaC
VAIDYGTLGLKGVIFEGISGMLDVVVSTILLYGLIAVAVDGGMMERCCTWLLHRNIMGTTRGAETVLTAGIVITNILLAGCVLPSILMFGGMADRIGQESGISPERRSILLTANATNFSAIIPINSAFVMGSVTIINEMVQKHSYLPTVSPFQIFSAAFYCLFLTGICVIWVALGERAGKGGHQKAQEISTVKGS